MKNLQGKRVLITCVGIKPVNYLFKDITAGENSHTPVLVDGQEHKANIGAATALACAQVDAIVHLVARTEEKLRIVKQWIETEIPDAQVKYTALDLNKRKDLQDLADSLPTDLPLYWVQSAGLGGGTVQIKDDNPYILIEELTDDLIDVEFSTIKNTIALLQVLLPRFHKQPESRICIVSSMSAIRSFPSGSIHMASKRALSRFANATMLELNKENIFITDIRPGCVDTGLYDSEIIQETIKKTVGISYGYDYEKTGPFFMPPTAVGEMIASVLTSKGHITLSTWSPAVNGHTKAPETSLIFLSKQKPAILHCRLFILTFGGRSGTRTRMP